MRRREFITLLGGGAAAAWPLAVRAQQAAKLPTIGFLGQSTPVVETQRLAAFLKRLRELGWIEGRTVAIEYAWGQGSSERFAEIAADFVRLKVDVIVTSGTANVIAAKQATSVIPIVFAVAGDPIANSLVASLARPGGANSLTPHFAVRDPRALRSLRSAESARMPAARGFVSDDRRTSAHVSDAPLGRFLGWRFWLCRKLKHRCLLTLA
jgi:hypothetical protein